MDTKRKIDIYGAGCDKYFQTVSSFRNAVQKCSAAWEVREITDGKKIAARGLMNLPGVFFDDKLILQGEGVSKEQARELLMSAPSATSRNAL